MTTRCSGWEKILISLSQYRHDFTALRAAQTRIVVGVGSKSGQMLAGRGAVAVAERLATAPVAFPGGHGGFLPGDGPYGGEPALRRHLRQGPPRLTGRRGLRQA